MKAPKSDLSYKTLLTSANKTLILFQATTNFNPFYPSDNCGYFLEKEIFFLFTSIEGKNILQNRSVINLSTYTHNTHTHTYIYTHTHTHTHIYIYIYIYTHKKKILFTSKLDLNLRKKLVKCYI